MAKTTTKDKTTTEAPQQAPASQPLATREDMNWNQFQDEIRQRESEIVSMLPPNVDPRRFVACAIAAVKQNPELLQCTRRSLFTAVTKSAQDGILPDGREGVITSYNTKVSKHGESDRYAKMAQWNPMVHGLRKRARELDRMLVDAQVVYDGDEFVWHQGDEPKIEHQPAPLGTSRGEAIGAYAIFKREDGTVLHREVMAKPEIETVHNQSKAQKSLMWTTFWTEGWRKTVIRRGIKSVPVSSGFEEIVRREDEHFDFGGAPETSPVIDGTMIPPRPKQSDFQPKEPVAQKPQPKETKAATKGDPRPEPPLEGEIAEQDNSQPQQFDEARDNEEDPEPSDGVTEEVIQEAPATSAAYDAAERWINAAEETIAGEENLDDLQKKGRTVIDSFKGLSEEEGDALRGRFVTVILREKQRRQGRKR